MRRRQGRAAVIVAVGTSIAGGIPVFLLGALFVQLQPDTAAPGWALGLAVAAYWAAAAMISMLSGRILVAIGNRAGVIATLSIAAVSLLGSALLTPWWPWLLVWAIVGGAANGLGHPASNHLLHVRVSPRRIATAFGIKQGAVPFSAFIAGLTVPVLALTVGWRWGFAAVAVLVILLIVGHRFGNPPDRDLASGKGVRVPLGAALLRKLLSITIVTTLGAAAAGATSAYLVTAAIERGVPDAAAGILLSVGSLAGATARVVAGRVADRAGGRIAMPLAAGMIGVGAVGLVLMSLPGTVPLIVGGALELGIGWGWPGLTHFVVARVSGTETSAATGVVQTGSYIGSGGGPLLFGLLFSAPWSASWIWLIAAAVQVTAAIVAVMLVRRGADRIAGRPILNTV